MAQPHTNYIFVAINAAQKRTYNIGVLNMFNFIQSIDEQIILFMQNNMRTPFADELMKIVSTLGDAGICWILLCIVLMFFKKTRKAGIMAALALILGALFTNIIIKQLVARPRPYLTVEGLLPLLPAPDPHSFPSGHTTAAFAAAVGIWLQFKKSAPTYIALFFAVLMGVSRVYVGAHYPSDVIAGTIIGTLSAIIVYYVQKRFFKDKLNFVK